MTQKTVKQLKADLDRLEGRPHVDVLRGRMARLATQDAAAKLRVKPGPGPVDATPAAKWARLEREFLKDSAFEDLPPLLQKHLAEAKGDALGKRSLSAVERRAAAQPDQRQYRAFNHRGELIRG